METTAAVLLPLVAIVAAVRLSSRDAGLRRAADLFAVLVALWLAPAWLRMQTVAPLDFLLDSPPLRTAATYLQKNVILNDVPLQMLPWREAVVRCWRAGELPLLDRSAASGSPLWLNLQAAVLYPPNLLSLPFSTFAWPLFYAASKLMLALVGAYLFLRSLERAHGAAVFGAIAYAFSVFTIAFLLFPHTSVTTLLPLLLFFLKRRADGVRTAAPSAALTLFVMFTGGHPESLLHCAFVALPFAGLLLLQSNARAPLARDFALVGLVALLLAAPLMLPFAAYVGDTVRAADVAAGESFLATPPFDLQTFFTAFVPNFLGNPRVHNYRGAFNFNEVATWFAGLSTLALAAGAVAAAPRRHRFWLVLLAFFVLMSTEPSWLQRLVREIPLMNITANGRFRFAIALVLAILGSAGFDLLRDDAARRRIAHAAAIVFSLTVAICIASYPVFAQYGIRRLVFFTELAALGGTALVAISMRFPAAAKPGVLTALLFLDLFSITGLYNPATPRELFYPDVPSIAAMKANEVPYRVAGILRAFQQNQAVFHRLEDVRPHDPVAYAPYVHLLDRGGLDRSTYFEKFNSVPRPLFDFLGVRLIMAPPDNAPLPLPVAARDAGAVVYRSESAMPRWFVPSRVAASADPARDMLANADPHVVFAHDALTPAAATLRTTRYGSSSERLSIDSNGESFVASSEVALPGWKLSRNGTPWPLQTINGPFLGWRVPAGRSHFELWYEPPLLREGLIAALGGLVALAGWYAIAISRREERDSAA